MYIIQINLEVQHQLQDNYSTHGNELIIVFNLWTKGQNTLNLTDHDFQYLHSKHPMRLANCSILPSASMYFTHHG